MTTKEIRNIPCLGYKDEYNGDFDCLYEKPPDCENCIVNYPRTKGNIDPRTGKKHKIIER
jgi:hypothetical protein